MDNKCLLLGDSGPELGVLELTEGGDLDFGMESGELGLYSLRRGSDEHLVLDLGLVGNPVDKGELGASTILSLEAEIDDSVARGFLALLHGGQEGTVNASLPPSQVLVLTFFFGGIPGRNFFFRGGEEFLRDNTFLSVHLGDLEDAPLKLLLLDLELRKHTKRSQKIFNAKGGWVCASTLVKWARESAVGTIPEDIFRCEVCRRVRLRLWVE